MSDSSTKMLPALDPPARGLDRLLARRSSSGLRFIDWLPLVTASVAATVLIAITMRPAEIHMQADGYRLLGLRTEGSAGLRRVEGRVITELPSSEPNVQMYWLKPASPGAPEPESP